MKTFTIYAVGNKWMKISAYDYYIDSLGIITLINEDKKPVAVFSVSNIIGFAIDYDDTQNLQFI